MRAVLVAVLLMVPSVALAGWSVKAPPAWKRAAPDAESALVDRASRGAGERVHVEVRQWQALGGDAERQLTGILMVLPAGVNDETVDALADGYATATASSLTSHGFTVHTVKAPVLEGQGASARMLESDDLRVAIHTRVRRTATGTVQMLLVQCGERISDSNCAKAMKSIQLRAR